MLIKKDYNVNNKTNILFISSRADNGGGPAQMYDIANELPHDKFGVYTALPYEKPYYELFEKISNKVISIKKRSFCFNDLFSLVKFIKENNINIIHSHGKGAGIYSRILKLFFRNIKIIHTFHGFHFDNMTFFKRQIYYWTEFLFSYLTDKFINVSYSEYEQYNDVNISNNLNSEVIQNQVTLMSLNNLINFIASIKKADNNNCNIMYLTCATRFDEVKNIPFLIESFYKCLKIYEITNLKLRIIGNGEEYEKCNKLIKSLNCGNFIELPGYDKNAVQSIVSSNFYVSSSRREAIGLSILEARACGIPILLSKVVGHIDAVKNYDKTYFFEYNNFSSFKDALTKMIKENTENGINYDDRILKIKETEKLRNENYIKKYIELYQNII